MNLAIIGYGKMGKTIEAIAIERGHNIALIIGSNNKEDLNENNLSNCDVAIEFSSPESALENLRICAASKTNTVSGTTGWLENKEEIDKAFANNNTGFLYASNFSIGVNLFFEINRKLAALINQHEGFTAAIEEIHHIHKKDAPSGTAITIAKDIIDANDAYTEWTLDDNPQKSQIHINALREEEVFGTHEVKYSSEIDNITIQHEAKSRKGFAMGAVLAAEWINSKSGIFSMKDVLGLD